MNNYAESIFDLQSELCSAMSNPVRLQIVHLLRHGPLRVSGISEALKVHQSTISRHLSILKRVGILSATRAGTDVVYQVASPKIVDVCEMMREVLADRESKRSEMILGSED